MNAGARTVEDIRILYLNTVERWLLGRPLAGVSAATNLGTDLQAVSRRLRLRALRELAEHCLSQSIPGDFVIAGPGIGDACVMLQAVLRAFGVDDRRVVVLTAGQPITANDAAPTASDRQEAEYVIQSKGIRDLLTHFDLLDEKVVFLKGTASEVFAVELHRSIAVLMLFQLTAEILRTALTSLYPLVATGGSVFIGSPVPIVASQELVLRVREAWKDEGVLVPIDKEALTWTKQIAPERNAITPIRSEPIPGGSSRPFWSVIIPLFERRQYLKQCLDSVLDQDPGPGEMEVLVVDDASSSDMGELVHSLGRGRVVYSRNAVNRGQHATTNDAICRSRGQWIHILHDDDWVLPGFYDTMRQGVEGTPPSVGLAFCMYTNFNQSDGSLWTPPAFRDSSGVMEPSFLVRLIKSNPLNFPAIVYRRETFENVGGFREDLPCAGDWEFYVRVSTKYRWHHETANLARYRTNLINLTKEHYQNGLRARDFRRVLEGFARLLPPDLAAKILPQARVIHAREFTQIAVACLRAGNEAIAFRYLSEALRLDPDLPARAEFAELLKQPSSQVLRFKIRNTLLRSIS